jgi:LuxR family maltose regulon positive regulatory protein
LRHRAAEWHAVHGQPEEAVRYEQESGDRIAVLAMIGRHSRTMFGQGRTSTCVEWLGWVESERLMTADPHVALSGMIGLAINGEGERANRWADALTSIARDATVDAGDPVPEALASLGRSLATRHGPAAAVVDALEASRLIPASSPWRRVATTSLGIALLMDEQEAAAEAALAEATDAPDNVPSATNAEAIALGLQAMLTQRRGDLAATRSLLERADSIRERADITEQGPQALQDALVALLAIADGDPGRATERLTHAQKLRPLLSWAIPGLAVVARCQMAQVYLELADVAGARTLLLEVNDVLHRRPNLGSFGRQAEELRSRLGAARGFVGASTLTSAELRIVPMLATHFSFKEIGDRLFISGNTVKTHAMSIYRKLDATSRSEAVANAVEAGILEPAAVALVLQAIHRGPTHP